MMDLMKRFYSLTLAITTLVSLAWVMAPMVLIQPFSAQTPRGLAIAFALIPRGALLVPLLLALGLVAASLLWPRLASWKGKLPACFALLLLAGCAFLARWDRFEWMFHPLPHPGFAEAGVAKDVVHDDLVLGVQVGAESHAYPIRAMAYHHVVNDVIAGEPIVATY